MRMIVKTKDRLDPGYMALRDLSAWSGLGLTKLREALTDPFNPLPHYRVVIGADRMGQVERGNGKRTRGKGTIIVSLADFREWIETYRGGGPDLDKMVDDVMEGL